jgi:uncharacterized Tic20 family protein
MENKKIWGVDFKSLLMLGWLGQIFIPVTAMVIAIIFTYYFREEGKREPWLSEGFRQMANFSLAMYILTAILAIPAFVFMVIPVIGMVIGFGLFALNIVVAIYSLYVYIKGTIAAGDGQIYQPKYTFEFFK